MAIVRQQKKTTKKPVKQANTQQQVTIENLSHEAQGVSRSGQKVMFVAGTLPGETVEVRIEKQNRHFDQAQLLNIITPSPERVAPLCPHYKKCGACQLQHLDSAKQLGYKQENLDQQLKSRLKLDTVPWQTAINSEPFGYRRRARLGVRYRKQLDEIIVGFREEANHHLTAIDNCMVLEPTLSALIAPLQVLITGLEGRSRITQIELIASDDQQAVVLRHLKTLTANDVQALTAWAQSQNVQLFTQGDKPAPLQTVWPTQASPLFYEVLGQQLQFTVKNFIQGNAQVNKDMVAQALDWLNIQPQETVLDLFAGIGNFTLPMAKLAKSVVAVEGESAMVAQIEHNAKLNGVDNIQGFAMNLDDEILFARLPKADVVLLDPPRSGAAQMMPWLAKSKARIVYVACEPSALVRDAQILLSKGYTLEKVAVMDMFPQSKHVEAMALFEKHRK